MKSLKRRIGETYILYKIRVARGAVFTSEIDGVLNSFQKGGVIILLINSYFHWLPPLWLLPVLWAVQKALEYFLGWLDQNHLRWQHFENEYNSRYLNPWNEDLLNRVKSIEEHLK